MRRVGDTALAGFGMAIALAVAGEAYPADIPNITGTWERYPDDWFGEDPDHPPPPGGEFKLKEPYASEYAALKKKMADADAAGTPIATTSSRCLPEGMPTLMGGIYPIEILQTPGRITVLGEFLSQVRRVWLDQKMPQPKEMSPSYNGFSVGRWEGDILVVETEGVRTDVLFFDVPHSENMKITERIKLTAPDRLENRVVIDDPQILSTPYQFTFEYRKSDYQIVEYICDNNQILVDSEGKASLNLDSVKKKP